MRIPTKCGGPLVQPLHLPRGGRRPGRGQQVPDPVLDTDPVEQHLRARTVRPETTREDLPVVGQDLLRDPVPGQRLRQRLAHRPRRGPGHHPRAHHEPGVVIDPGHHLHLDPIGQVHPTHHVHLPQLHRPAPLPPPIVTTPPTPPGPVDPTPSYQRPVHRRTARHRDHSLPAQLVPDPVRTPTRMRIPQRQHPRLHHRRHLMRTRMRPRGPVRQVHHRALGGIPAQPHMHRRRATPNRRATSVTVAPSSTSSTARYRSSLTPSSRNMPGSLPRPRSRATKERTSPPRQPLRTAGLSGTYRNDCRAGTGTVSPTWKAGTGTRWSSMNRNCTDP